MSLLLTFGFSRQFSNIFLISSEPILREEVALAQTVESKDQETKDKAKIDEKITAQFILRGSERTDETPLFDVKDIPFNKLPFPFNSPDVLALIVLYFFVFSITLRLILEVLAFTLSPLIKLAHRVLAFTLSPLTWVFGDYQKRYIAKSKEDIYSESKKQIYPEDPAILRVDAADRIVLFNLARIEQYYQLNISQAAQSFRFSILLILIGTGIIAITVLLAITKPDLKASVTIISGISGIILDIIGGSALLLYGKTITQVNRFFSALLRDQDTMLAIDLCQKLKELKESEYIHVTKQMISCLADRSSSLNLSLSNLDNSLTDSTNEKNNSLKKQEQKDRNDKIE